MLPFNVAAKIRNRNHSQNHHQPDIPVIRMEVMVMKFMMVRAVN
jgi:hypothetical protein